MNHGRRLRDALMLVGSVLALPAAPALAAVVVTVSGNQAVAQVSLPGGAGSVDADVTITFDTPVNLNADELNVSAQLVDPNDPALLARLPLCSPACVAIDPAFPLLVTVEPLTVPWLFHSGFETDGGSSGVLGFLNSYQFEIHTPDLDCAAAASGEPCPTTAYRLFKAPLAGAFSDYTSELLKGSVRARGRDGAFSQFLIVADTRPSLLVELDKALRLNTRLLAASIDEALRGDLLALLDDVQIAVLAVDYAAAIARLDALIATIQADAGITIANRWSADHSLVDDAGELEGLARTLRYTLARLQNGN